MSSTPSSLPISRTLIAYVEDHPGVLNRVTSLLRRRGYSIDSLTVGPTERQAISQVTLVVRMDEDATRRLIANLYKLVEVIEVEDATLSAAAVRELALIKVRATSETVSAVRAMCDAIPARIIEEGPSSVTVEVTGTRAQVDAAVEVLRARGVLRLVRTGAVAVSQLAEEKAGGISGVRSIPTASGAAAGASTPAGAMKAAGGAAA